MVRDTNKGGNVEKGSVLRVFLACLLFCSLLIPISCSHATPGTASELKESLEKAGFSVQQGKFGQANIFGMEQAGLLATCNYQNAGAAYITPKLPPAPGQSAPCYFSDAAIEPADQGLFIDYRVQPDEAIVFAGKTPPKCKYFGYDANIVTRWNQVTGKPAMIFGNYGDPINPLVIKTDGPADDPYARNTMIVMTADKGVASKIKAAAGGAGYSENIINEYPIPSQLLKLGLGQESDTLTLLHRFAYPVDEKAGNEYLANPTMSVFRVTPGSSPEPDLYDMPSGRIRGTGDYKEPALSHEVEGLRQAILKKFGNLAAQEFTTSTWGADGLDAIQEMQSGYGPGRDAQYLKTTDFTLADDPNEFVIVYGINHAAIGKATYSSLSVYGTQQANGVASAWSGEYAGTAEEYLPGDPDAKYLYVWKIARSSNGDAHTTVVPFNQGINGIDVDQSMFLGFRAYLENSTKTGPIATELYYDRAIKFSSKQ
jgi:hypothetical protein